jgi:hypothetical protein
MSNNSQIESTLPDDIIIVHYHHYTKNIKWTINNQKIESGITTIQARNDKEINVMGMGHLASYSDCMTCKRQVKAEMPLFNGNIRTSEIEVYWLDYQIKDGKSHIYIIQEGPETKIANNSNSKLTVHREIDKIKTHSYLLEKSFGQYTNTGLKVFTNQGTEIDFAKLRNIGYSNNEYSKIDNLIIMYDRSTDKFIIYND